MNVPLLSSKKRDLPPPRLRILMVAAEIAPWAKVGGLGDVIAALPSALAKQGAEVVLAIPRYLVLREAIKPREDLHERPFRMRWNQHATYELRIQYASHESGYSFLLVDCPPLFERAGIYHPPGVSADYADSLVRWTALCRGALFGASLLGGEWDIIHAHDMHAALTLPLLQEEHKASPLASARRVLSIHNLAYQGVYPLSAVHEIGLSSHLAHPLGPYEYFGNFNCLKAGITSAHGIHTVSPTYAYEIVEDPDSGHGLQGVLWQQRDHVVGILNGIDTEIWNPLHQPALPAHFSKDDLQGKRLCKDALQVECGWKPDPKRPLFGIVSRLTSQKGLDLVAEALPLILHQQPRLVLLGTGDPKLETLLRNLASAYPDHVHVRFAFDPAFAHRLLAGSDLCLMPSRFEPCGLVQMYAMRYGTIPVVRRTGGLADTVDAVDTGHLSGTGFLFDEATPEDLAKAALQACLLFQSPELWQAIIKNGMQRDFSWEHVAGRLMNWYRKILAA